jgi:hypothetical protein
MMRSKFLSKLAVPEPDLDLEGGFEMTALGNYFSIDVVAFKTHESVGGFGVEPVFY